MENHEIKELAVELMDAMCAKKLAECEVETDDFRISLKAQGPAPVMQSVSMPTGGTVSAVTEQVSVQTEEKAMSTQEEIAGTRVEAPLVGIFYSAPSPEEPPFVEVGQKVSKGDTICIIEAMKTMNEITAPCDGTVSRIFAQNGDVIEYKQLIAVIE